MMFGLLMARLSVSRTPIVRTAHNLRLPQGISRREAFLLKIADRRTSLRILLNSATTVVPGQAYVTIPHGHYIDWFQPYPALSPKRGRIAYFGLIRHYKNVEGLIRAFRGRQEGSGLQLLVAGKPSNGELGQRLLDAAGNDGDIELNLQFLTDEELVHAVTGAALVALPYREMHNSGGALTALSLGRPVLVPTNEVNTLLSEEVGAGWVFCYDGELTAAHLACAMAELATYPADRPGPDLSDRGWNQVGAQHLAAYRRAVAIVRIRRNRPLKKQRVTGG
jgi:beta-1,4-mannosyltransferase